MSKLISTRAEFQSLADQRLIEAKALLDLGHWDGAYYLAGYAVELALKACIIKFSKHCYTHALDKLILTARLDAILQTATAAAPQFDANWHIARDWNEEKRYHRIEQIEAEAMYAAVSDSTYGVLPWIKT